MSGGMEPAKRAALLLALNQFLARLDAGLAQRDWNSIRQARSDCARVLRSAAYAFSEPTLEERLAALMINEDQRTVPAAERGVKRQRIS